jgi:uncharacterized membrane protein (DUF373 family)
MLSNAERWLRDNSSQQLRFIEAIIYLVVGFLLILAALVAAGSAGLVIWQGVNTGMLSNPGIVALDRLLLVLMLVEILHTVRISISSHELSMEPFLVVGIIASIRRVLVLTMQAAKFTEEGHQGPDAIISFRNSMIELAVLGILILIFVVAISLLRRSRSTSSVSVVETAADDGLKTDLAA